MATNSPKFDHHCLNADKNISYHLHDNYIRRIPASNWPMAELRGHVLQPVSPSLTKAGELRVEENALVARPQAN